MYFDQQAGASHDIHWSDHLFQRFNISFITNGGKNESAKEGKIHEAQKGGLRAIKCYSLTMCRNNEGFFLGIF